MKIVLLLVERVEFKVKEVNNFHFNAIRLFPDLI